MRLVFSDGAVDWLVGESVRSSRSVRELCAERFRDFQFGLRLIQQNTGRQEFEIDEAAVQSPEKTLSEWVVESYRGREEGSPPVSPS